MSALDSIRNIRIFISSPGDVAEERNRARQVIESLRRRYSRRLKLSPVLWEDFPLQSDISFQQGIDLVLSEDLGIDIAVFILWSRLGSSVGPVVKKNDGGEYRSGTERELDLMLEARRQNGGDRPALLVYTRGDETSFEERLRGKPTSEKEKIISQKRLVEQFIQEEFQDPSRGHNLRAFHTFDRPVTFSNRLRVHLTSLLDELAGENSETIWDVHKQGPPFLGLKSFQPEHADIFFGREEEILEARFALREQAKQGCAFLLLTGASGSGKSSLARAGVLPEIIQNEVDDETIAWRSLIVTPAELMSDPVVALLRRLAQQTILPGLENGASSLETIASDLMANPDLTFRHAIRPLFNQPEGRVRLLLVIDQLEESFVSNLLTNEHRTRLLTVLEAFARSGTTWVLATVRNDFYHLIQADPILARLLQGRGPMPVSVPSPDALQRLIEEPARLAGLRFEEKGGISLAARILRDAASHAELLPLLEFVLQELFDGRTPNGELTFATYERLGGVEGALGTKAEEAFQSLPVDARESIREILPLLVSVEIEGDQPAIRRRARLDDLQSTPARMLLTDRLIESRFLTTDQRDEIPVASLAHEALLRCWERIAQWIASNQKHLQVRTRVEQSQQRWEHESRHESLLLPSGVPLNEGRELLAEAPQLVNSGTTEYIRISIDAHDAAMEQHRKGRRTTLMALGILTAVASLVGVFAWFQMQAADLTRKVSQIGDQFQLLLDQPVLETSYIDRGEEILASLHSIAPDRVAVERDRLHQTYLKAIEAEINQVKLVAGDEVRYTQAINRLSSEEPEQTERLMKLLAGRLRSLQPVFELRQPFEKLHDVFDTEQVNLREGHLHFKSVIAAQSSTEKHLSTAAIPTKMTANGNVRFEMELDSRWQSANEIGLELRYGPSNRYLFLMKAEPFDTNEANSESSPNPSRAWIVKIIRNQSVLREQKIDGGAVKEASLRLRSERNGDRLEFQIAELPNIAIEDLFAIRSPDPVRFAVILGEQVGVLNLEAYRMPQSTVASPLEQANDLFAEANFEASLAQFRQAAALSSNPELGQESRYKQALCLLQLGRNQEATSLLESLGTEAGQKWPAIAAIQLWAVHIRQHDLAAADTMFSHISNSYSASQLAVLIPEDLRNEVLGIYRERRNTQFSRTLTYDPQLVFKRERQLQLEELLGHDEGELIQAQIRLIDAVWASENANRTHQLAETLFRRTDRNSPHMNTALGPYVSSLLLRGKPAVALEAIDDLLFDAAGQPRTMVQPWYWLRRAHCHAHLKQYDLAEQDLAELDRRTSHREAIWHALYTAPLRGLLLEKRGDFSGARAVWRQAVERKSEIYTDGAYYVLRSLSGDFDLSDAELLLGKLSNADTGTLAKVIKGTISPESLVPIGKAAFQAEAGRESAWQISTGMFFPGIASIEIAKRFGYELLRQGAFAGEISAEQETLLWVTFNELYHGITHGEINMVQAGQMAMTWKGTMSLFGWSGLAPTLPARIRSPSAYLMAHRMLRKGQSRDATTLFQTVLNDQTANPVLRRLAERDLALLAAGQGLLSIHNTSPLPRRVDILANDQVLQELTVAQSAEVPLNAGDYRLRWKEPQTDTLLSAEQVSLPLCGRRSISLEWAWEPGTIERRLPGPITRPAIRPDLRRWQVVLRQPVTPISSATLDPQGRFYACGGNDGVVRIYSRTDQELNALFLGHTGPIRRLAWSPDGKQLLSGSDDRTARIWNFDAKAAGTVLQGPQNFSVATWGPGPGKITTGAQFWQKNPIRIWNLDGLQQLKIDVDAEVHRLEWNPSGEQLAIATHLGLLLWNGNQSSLTHLNGHTKEILSLDWSPDATHFASGDVEGRIQIWPTATWRAGPAVELANDRAVSLRWNPAGDRLAMGTDNGILKVYDVRKQAEDWQHPLQGHGSEIRWSPDGESLWTIGRWPGQTTESSRDGSRQTRSPWKRSGVVKASLGPDGRHVLVRRLDEPHSEIWTTSGKLLAKVMANIDYQPSHVSWSPDGRWIAAAREYPFNIEIIDSNTGEIRATLSDLPPGQRLFAWNSDSTAIAIGTGNLIYFWKTSGERGQISENLPNQIRALSWQPGSDFVSASYYNDFDFIHTWHGSTGKPGPKTRIPEFTIPNGLRWRPDGKHLAIVSDDTRVAVIDHQGALKTILTANGQRVPSDITWNRDFSLIATTYSDGSCLTWRPDGTRVAEFLGHTAACEQVVFTEDGRDILTYSLDQSIRQWNASTGAPLSTLLPLPDREFVIFGPGGDLLHSSADPWSHLICVGENLTGQFELREPAAFFRVQEQAAQAATPSPESDAPKSAPPNQ